MMLKSAKITQSIFRESRPDSLFFHLFIPITFSYYS